MQVRWAALVCIEHRTQIKWKAPVRSGLSGASSCLLGACPGPLLSCPPLLSRRQPPLPPSSAPPPDPASPPPPAILADVLSPSLLSSDLTSRNNSSSPAQQISGSARSRRPSPIYICPQGPCKLPPSAPSNCNIRTLLPSSSFPPSLLLCPVSRATSARRPSTTSPSTVRPPLFSLSPFVCA